MTLSPFREDVELAASTETASLPGYGDLPPLGETWYTPETGTATAEEEAWASESEGFDFGEAEAESEASHPILTLFPLPPAVLEALSTGLSSVAVGLAANAGYRDANTLTNIIFYFRHPNLIGRKIRADERDLATEWISIRDRVVKPALQSTAAGLPTTPVTAPPPTPPVTAPEAISPDHLQWPGHSQEERDFMKAVYRRHRQNSRGDFVMDLPKSSLAPIEGHEARKDAAEAARQMLEEARIVLAREHPDVEIGIVSAYRPATRQFQIWQGRDPRGQDKGSGFPYYYREAIAKGIVRAGDFGPDAVAKVAKYLGGYIASPGYSNHQDGLAFDFGTSLKGKRLAAIGWKSWFRKWLEDHAAEHHFLPLSTEAWHWTYHPPSDSREIWAAELEGAPPVRANEVQVPRVPMLAKHRGSPPDLILRWNDMPSMPEEVDVAVHLHGFWYDRMRLDRDIKAVSGLDLVPANGEQGQGRTRPTLTLLPRGHNTGVKQTHGPYTAYTFPALVTKSGLTDLVRVALDRFAAEVGRSAPRVGRLILTAHSGGGKALLQILQYHDPHQVHVYDALYWPPDALVAWARKRIRKDRDALAGGASPANYMSTQGGGLRVFYQGGYAGGTRPNSLSVRNTLAADIDATIAPWYRVEASKYDHFQIPRLYGWRALADVAADMPSAYAEETRRREAELEAADFEWPAYTETEKPEWEAEAWDQDRENGIAFDEDERAPEHEEEDLFGESELWEAEDEGIESPEVERGEVEAQFGELHEGATVSVLPALEAPMSPIQRVTEGPVTKSAADYFLWVLDDVVYNGTSRLISDLSDRARPAFEKLFAAIAGHDVHGRKLDGRERRQSFDEAVLALRDVLPFASEEQRAALRRKRDGLLYDEAADRVENSVVVGKQVIEIPDDGHPREQARVLHEVLPTIVHTLQVATEQLHRLAEGGHEQYENAIRSIEQELERSPRHHELEQLLDRLEKDARPGQRTVERLGVLIAFLGTVDGWLTLSDEELRAHLTEIHGVLPAVSSFAELVKAVTEIGIGTVSLTAAFASGIAKLAGDEALAAEAMTVAGQAGGLLGNVVAGIEIVHGIFILLDSNATHAQKEDAVVGIASGGAWFIGRAIGGAAMGGPASIAIAASYLLLKVSAVLYWQGALGINALLMRETFEYLRDVGTSLARVSGRVERAGLLLQAEKDPIKAKPLRDVRSGNEKMLGTILDDFLAHCTPGGAKDMGLGGSFPTAPGNVQMLSEAFAPLLRYRTVKSGPKLLAGTAAVVQRIAWCLVHAREIEIASTKHKHLSDIAGAPAP